jgi:hypothetical protein
MARGFDLDALKKETVPDNRYERRIAALTTEGQETERIKSVVDGAIHNIGNKIHSFVIYGEPQSGKTEMMIALTAKLLDIGMQIVIVLLNDSVQLLGQNLERFQRSGIAPAPKKFSEILSPDVVIGQSKWVIFSKKNGRDLEKLNEKLRKYKKKVIIDDEADYATPNAKVNVGERTKINALTQKLIGEEGVYIGVTATPARLDLNRTHDNQNEYWIDLPTHQNYTGQDVFFPSTFSLTQLPYKLVLLPNQGDHPSHLRKALFGFMVNVAYLNSEINDKEENYSILVHTSGKKADHAKDYKEIVKTFTALRDEGNARHNKFLEDIWNLAKERYPGHEDTIAKYVLKNNERNNVVVMNSDKEKNMADNRTATNPSATFTIAIGGNIVSRGVTFNNLLSMYFTRDVKHHLQQDTYVQRARMFGSRNNYLKYFELTIPNTLYLDWQQCFIFHRLSLESRRQGSGTPVWLEGGRISATSGSSIDQAHVLVDHGEMSFGMFVYDSERIKEFLSKKKPTLEILKGLSDHLGVDSLPKYLLNYIENFSPNGESSVAIHDDGNINGYKDADHTLIARTKGLIGQTQLKKFPNAIHHIKIYYNAVGKARVFYKYQGNIRFLKTK